MQRSRVDLPEPDGPVSTTRSPGAMARDAPWMIGAPSSPGFVVRSSMAISGVVPMADNLPVTQAVSYRKKHTSGGALRVGGPGGSAGAVTPSDRGDCTRCLWTRHA